MLRTLTRVCTHNGCTERGFFEYTNQRERRSIESKPWKCVRHIAPNEVLSKDSPDRTTVLTLEPIYSHPSTYRPEPEIIGYSWRAEHEASGSGFRYGPGFQVHAEDFPPGTRLIVTARIELPEEAQQ